MTNELYHYGVKYKSGRYPYGSGKNPFQSDPGYKYQRGEVARLKKEKRSWKKTLEDNADDRFYKVLEEYSKFDIERIDEEIERYKSMQACLFVSGSSKTQDESSKYYRKELPKDITDELNKAITNGKKIVVGDAPGIDRQVQDYLAKVNYKDVEVYSPGKECRYIANENWENHKVNSICTPGGKAWLAVKDIAMTNASTEGLSIILDNGANATRRNVQRLIESNKYVKVYQLNESGDDSWVEDPKTVKPLD